MKKKTIGILDAGLEGLPIFNALVKKFPNNSFIYLNDYTAVCLIYLVFYYYI